tara:strand:+ start:1913 stop:5410 length:3498 start_codon:yes stop_codon:yes gene_type:complete
MYISGLRIQGFKSFYNKTKLEFAEGVTSIIGPNGCGKSNIVDAIRWVLGEQKTSILRSNKMEDVIFNGAKNKKPLNFCEVTMLIHNNSGILPVEYTDVEISRRYYRNGESEFYINKNLCRLKDIQNLFIDTGMKSNAYSVIELGMIDTILSDNAKERRKMFEEAAGINNYKYQKAAALKKISQTKIDIIRVKDILSEVNNSINNLKSQFKKYEQYNKTLSITKELKIDITIGEIKLLINEQKPQLEKIKKFKTNMVSISKKLNDNEVFISEINQKFKIAKNKLNKIDDSIDNYEKKLTDSNANILVFSEKLLANKNQKLYFSDEISSNNNNKINSLNKLKKLNKNKKNIKPIIKSCLENYQLEEIKYQNIIEYFKKIQIDNDKINFLYEDKNKILQIEKNKKFQLENKILNNNNIINSNIAKIKTLKINLDKAKDDNKKLNKKLSHQIKDHNLKYLKFENCKAEIDRINQFIFHFKNKQNDYLSKRKIIENEIVFYENMFYNQYSDPDQLKEILTNKNVYPYVLGVLSDLLIVDDEYKGLVDILLGDLNNSIIVDRLDNASDIIINIDLNISLICLDQIPIVSSIKLNKKNNYLINHIKCSAQIKALLHIIIGDIIILNKKNVFIDKFDNINTLSANKIVYKKGYFLQSNSKQNVSMIGRKKKLICLKEDLKLHNQNNIKEDIETYEKNKKHILNEIKLLSKKIENLNKTKLDLVNKKNNFSYLIINLNKSLSELKLQNKEKKKNNLKLNDQYENVLKNIIKIEDENTLLLEDKNNFNSQISNFRKKKNMFQEKLQKIKIDLLEYKKEDEGLDFRINSCKNQLKEIDKNIKKYKERNDFIDNDNKKISLSISNGKLLSANLSNKLKNINNKKNIIKKKYDLLFTELEQKQSEFSDNQINKNNIADLIKDAEIKISSNQNKIDSYIASMNDLYKFNITQKIIDNSNFDIIKKKKYLEKNINILSRIGPINLAVKDEYKNEVERLNFLKNQLLDLESTEEIINKTINKLDSEAESIFLKTFNSIKINFSKTYARFFEGGEGKLSLIDPSNILESDIKILARPPGKKTHSLRMLSAGEKALTAISLLFAIYLVKPSPFCILDEVDAPLDDSNVVTFAKVLKTYSSKTQFIVVTHNKLTMEHSDSMYGITQIDNGISKLVSVKFKNSDI